MENGLRVGNGTAGVQIGQLHKRAIFSFLPNSK